MRAKVFEMKLCVVEVSRIVEIEFELDIFRDPFGTAYFLT